MTRLAAVPSIAPTPGGALLPPDAPAFARARPWAEMLGLCARYLQQEAAAGRLACVRAGRAVLFRREDIETWLQARYQGARR